MDKNGNLNNWFQKNSTTYSKFLERKQCIIDQLNEHKIFLNISTNGVFTQSEAIADNAGLKHAYYVSV